MNSMKRQNDMTLEDETPTTKHVQHVTGKEQRAINNSSRKNEWLGQNGNNTKLWTYLVLKVKSDALRNNVAWKPGMLGPWIKVNWTWSSRRWQD